MQKTLQSFDMAAAGKVAASQPAIVLDQNLTSKVHKAL
jgi:hypothetical protein